MTVIIMPICCFLLTRPRSHSFSPPPDHLIAAAARTHLPARKLETLPLDAEKFSSLSVNASSAASVLLRKYPLGQGMEQMSFLNGCVSKIQLPSGQKKLIDMLLRADKFRPSTVAVFMANALMFASPMEALAETCEADNSFFNMPLLLFVALVGATVGGLLARQRKGELKRLNEQLRQINAALRRQAKIESYAPNLSYAPVGSSRIAESEVIVDPRKHELISRLKSGKNFLRIHDPEKAFTEFQAALELAQSLNDSTEKKKAARGLGASLQRQGRYQEAIKYHSMVLAISEQEGEDSGNTEAYGAIADCYTELGDLERAGLFYDKYIARLEKD